MRGDLGRIVIGVTIEERFLASLGMTVMVSGMAVRENCASESFLKIREMTIRGGNGSGDLWG